MKRRLATLLSIGISITAITPLHAQSTTANSSDSVLTNKRREIDSLDKKLFAILGERERAVKEIGIYKAKNHIPSLQAARFQQVLEKGIEAGKKENLSEEDRKSVV